MLVSFVRLTEVVPSIESPSREVSLYNKVSVALVICLSLLSSFLQCFAFHPAQKSSPRSSSRSSLIPCLEAGTAQVLCYASYYSLTLQCHYY